MDSHVSTVDVSGEYVDYARILEQQVNLDLAACHLDHLFQKHLSPPKLFAIISLNLQSKKLAAAGGDYKLHQGLNIFSIQAEGKSLMAQ